VTPFSIVEQWPTIIDGVERTCEADEIAAGELCMTEDDEVATINRVASRVGVWEF